MYIFALYSPLIFLLKNKTVELLASFLSVLNILEFEPSDILWVSASHYQNSKQKIGRAHV